MGKKNQNKKTPEHWTEVLYLLSVEQGFEDHTISTPIASVFLKEKYEWLSVSFNIRTEPPSRYNPQGHSDKSSGKKCKPSLLKEIILQEISLGLGSDCKFSFQLRQHMQEANQPDALTTKAHTPTGTGTDLRIYFHTLSCSTNREQGVVIFASLGLISADGSELTNSASLTHFMVQRDGYMCQ